MERNSFSVVSHVSWYNAVQKTTVLNCFFFWPFGLYAILLPAIYSEIIKKIIDTMNL